MLLALLAPVIASVVRVAEKKFSDDMPKQGELKKRWCEEMVLDFWDVLANIPALGKVFSFILPARELVAREVGELIQRKVNKLKEKGKL